jgi:hypothetical protein
VVKLVSLIISGILGASLAGVGAVGVVSAVTSAPKHNPASSQVVDYGNR